MSSHRIPQLPFLYLKFVGLHILKNPVVFNARNYKNGIIFRYVTLPILYTGTTSVFGEKSLCQSVVVFVL